MEQVCPTVELRLFLKERYVHQLFSRILDIIISCRVYPSKEWIDSQVPEIIKNGVKGIGIEIFAIDEMDAESFFQAYVYIVTGACISLGKLSFVLSARVNTDAFCICSLV